MVSTEARLDRKKFLELQYNTLRKEIDDSRALHTKMTTGALIIGPALPILAKATEYLSSKSIESFSPNSTDASWVLIVAPRVLPLLLLMLSPLIVLSLYMQFVSEHYAIGRCAQYIRKYIEKEIQPKYTSWQGWESWLTNQDSTREEYQTRGFYVLYGSIYVITAFFAAAYAAISYTTLSVVLWSDSSWIVPFVLLLIIVFLYLILGVFVWYKMPMKIRSSAASVSGEDKPAK